VAATALLQRDGAHALCTAGPDGRARALPVQLLDQEGEEALVDAGPAGWPAGRLVVERPPPGLVEGGAVAEGAR
jgi:hypothetical protein